MASNREKRRNAGSRLPNLLERMEPEEFYLENYGGFKETSSDMDYIPDSASADNDSADSDISFPEHSSGEAQDFSDDDDKENSRPKQTPKIYNQHKNQTAKKAAKAAKAQDDKTIRRSFRESTTAKSIATENRLMNQKEKGREKKKKQGNERWPSQDEMLEEAKITEKENRKSLAQYEEMVLEKKKFGMKKKGITVPFIRFRSIAMPLVEEIPSPAAPTEGASTSSGSGTADATQDMRCERTVISFSDPKDFQSAFHYPPRQVKEPKVCPLTGVVAKYLDPVTNLPFSCVEAHRVLQDAYVTALEATGDPRDPEIKQWLESRQKQKLENSLNSSNC